MPLFFFEVMRAKLIDTVPMAFRKYQYTIREKYISV